MRASRRRAADQVWINDQLVTDFKDTANHAANGATEGMIAIQMHFGAPKTPRWVDGGFCAGGSSRSKNCHKTRGFAVRGLAVRGPGWKLEAGNWNTDNWHLMSDDDKRTYLSAAWFGKPQRRLHPRSWMRNQVAGECSTAAVGAAVILVGADALNAPSAPSPSTSSAGVGSGGLPWSSGDVDR